MVGLHRKRTASARTEKAPIKIARNLFTSFMDDPPKERSHAQPQRGRGRGKVGHGGKAKRNPVRPRSPPPAATPPQEGRLEAPVSHSPVSEEERVDEPVSCSPVPEDESVSHSPVPDDGEEEDDGLIIVLEGQSVFLRGASRLPKRGKPVEQRPCITPYGVSAWTEVGDEEPGKYRHVNGVIGILLKEHFPGMVTFPGEGNVPEVAWTWDHYKACEDVGTFNNIEVHSKAERVFAEIWDFYRCEDGKLEEAQANVNIHCKKLVRNMFYDARIIAVRSYKASKGIKMTTKKPATKIFLEKEEYMQATPRWCVDKGECWERIVDYWCSKEYMLKHIDYKSRRKAMIDPPHHQGNLSLKGFTKCWARHHKAPEPNLFVGYALSHKASFRKAMPYDPCDTSSAYTSNTAYNRLTKVREVATKLRGPDYDVASEPLDHELVMIVGQGRKHGQEAIGGGMFSRSSTRTLPEHKARLGLAKSFVCERATPARAEMESLLEEKLAEERRLLAEERVEERRLEAEERAEERRLAAAERAEERRLAAEERAEERRLADQRTQQALWAQNTQNFQMFTAYCTQNGMPAFDMSALTLRPTHPSTHGSNNAGSSHAPGLSGNNPDGSPHL